MHKLYDDDDEWRREFRDTFSGIHASENLRDVTLAQMMENDKTQRKEGKKRQSAAGRKWWITVPAAALLCVVFMAAVWKGAPETPYLTQLEDDVFCEEVNLKDGVLHFVTGRVVISVTPSAGDISAGWEQEGKMPEAEDETQILEEKENADGGQLIYKKIESVKLPDTDEENWSHIGEQKIYITVLDTPDTRYSAVFEKDGQTYEVVGTGVLQREFIDYLYLVVKK